MSDNILFEAEDYAGNGDLAGQEAIDHQESNADGMYLSGDPCPNGDCENTHNPAEEAWVKLVSAIPVAGQLGNLKCIATGIAAPTQEEVQSLVGQIRPADADKYALKEIAWRWALLRTDFAENPDTAVAPLLQAKLRELSNGWQGDDFDAFALQMAVIFANCDQIDSDIGTEATGMVGLLNQKGDEIYALQGGGSGELPYPAPQYWVEDKKNLFSDTKIHMRPPFHSGKCEISSGCSWNGDQGAEEAMEYGGFDAEYTDERNQYVVDQTDYHYANLKAEHIAGVDTTGMTPAEKTEATTLTPEQDASLRAEAERLAQQDANERAEQDYDAGSQDYEARATEQNETVTARWTDAESAAAEFVPTVAPVQDTVFQESAGELTDNGYTPPGGGDFNGLPNSSGTAGLNPPPTTTSFGPGGNVGNIGGDGNVNTALDPWEYDDGDEYSSGGLAAGGDLGTLPGPGTGFGTGGGTGSGSGGALGPTTGLLGPSIGSATSASGRGGATPGYRALAKGPGLFGNPTGGARGGAPTTGPKTGAPGRNLNAKAGSSGSMGGRGANAAEDEEEQSTDTWLTEDEDVWGTRVFDDRDNPYQ